MRFSLSLWLDEIIIWESASFYNKVFDVALVVFTCEVE